MKYTWEKKISQATIARMQALLPDGYVLRGVAVENHESVEAALIRNRGASSGNMEAVDAWTDILGDAVRIFSDNRAILFPKGTEHIAAQLGVPSVPGKQEENSKK
jgi:hypothetical protein